MASLELDEIDFEDQYDKADPMGYSRKYPNTPHGRHWKSCKKCSVSMTGNPQICPKFCKF